MSNVQLNGQLRYAATGSLKNEILRLHPCSLSGACLPRRGRSRINWPQVFFFFSWFCFQSCCGRNKEGWFGTWHEATLEKDERAFFMTNDVAGSVSSHTRSAVWRSDNKPLLCFDLLASFHIGAILYDCNAGTIRTFVKREQAVDLLFQRINRGVAASGLSFSIRRE